MPVLKFTFLHLFDWKVFLSIPCPHVRPQLFYCKVVGDCGNQMDRNLFGLEFFNCKYHSGYSKISSKFTFLQLFVFIGKAESWIDDRLGADLIEVSLAQRVDKRF